MRIVVQRVKEAKVSVGAETVGAVGVGLLLYIGAGRGDGAADAACLAEKVPNLRIFPDEEGKMNRSLLDIGGAILAVSQFTLYGDCRKGRRPGFSDSLAPAEANRLYEALVEHWRGMGIPTETGVFQEEMLVSSVNWGPATFLLDSEKRF